MAKGERIVIDFSETTWLQILMSKDCENTNEIEFINFNSEVKLPSNLSFPSLRNIYFKESNISQFPEILRNLELNLISFTQTEFTEEFIKCSFIKSVKWLSINGERTTRLPKNILSLNGLEYIFITSTNLMQIEILNDELPKLKELTIQGNKELIAINGELGKQETLIFLDLFGNTKLESIKISTDNNISKLRIGSWSDKNPIFKEFNNLKSLREVIIDNYRTQSIDISFLRKQKIENLKIYCPNKENIDIITTLENLKDLMISRQINCRESSLVFNELSNLEKLERLELNLGGNTTRESFEKYIYKFPNLSNVILIDTNWSEYGEIEVKKIKVYINN